MRFKFQVGDTEKQIVHFHRDPWFGQVTIETDDQTLFSGGAMFTLKRFWEYKFILGETEKHKVRIEHSAPAVLPGFCKHTFNVYIDGELIQGYRGF